MKVELRQRTAIGDLRLIEVDDPAVLRQIFALRIESWKTFIHVDASRTEWTDKFDERSRHWGIIDGKVPVAAARLTVTASLATIPDSEYYEGILSKSLDGPIGSFNRMCVRPDYRGLGLSLLLDQARLSAARVLGCKNLVVRTSAGSARIAQLESIGFQFVAIGRQDADGPLSKAPPPHVMLWRLPA